MPPKDPKDPNALKLVSQELKNPHKQLNLVFFLISIIPILSFCYILFGRHLAGNGPDHDIMLVLFFSNAIVILGYIAGVGTIGNILKKVSDYAERARNADRLKSTFALELAHDLKNPLSVIKANMSNLKAGLLGELTGQQDETAAVCKNTADRMDQILTNLIETYTIQAQKTEPVLSHFDLRELISEQRREISVIAEAKALGLSCALPKRALPVLADRAMILRVINNLLNNSVKYTASGGKVSIKADAEDGFARLEISNTGTPIPENMLETIFSKFERLDLTIEGQGLGLAIARDIVELHQGKIWASSGPGQPNCFTVLLPLAGK